MNDNKREWLDGHTCRKNAYTIKDYPYGFKKTTMFIWLETTKRGTRVVRQTINPNTLKENKPKKSVYYGYVRLYMNEEGHVKSRTFDLYSVEWFLKAQAEGLFLEKEKEKEFEKLQTIITIKSLAIYGGYDFELIKDFNILELDKLDQKEKEGDKEYINKFKTEDGRKDDFSPFKTTSYIVR